MIYIKKKNSYIYIYIYLTLEDSYIVITSKNYNEQKFPILQDKFEHIHKPILADHFFFFF